MGLFTKLKRYKNNKFNGMFVEYLISFKAKSVMKYWFLELHGTPLKRKLTVGKIYAGLLVLENYRSYKQSLAKYGEARPVILIRISF